MTLSMQEQVLALFLGQDEEYVSGELMSQRLGISRTAVWKQIKKLEALGYEFEAVTKLGYRLKYTPDSLETLDISSKLQQHRLGHEVHVYAEVSSTQEVAKELAEKGAREGTVVLAEQQTKGRGRLGRAWHSPYGKGLYMSVILRPTTPLHLAPQLTLITAVALSSAVRKLTGLPIGIKWPNDLLFEGKKISGIILESTAEDNMLKYVIAGIGIAVNLIEQDYETELLEKATSLRISAGKSFAREKLLCLFLDEWALLLDMYEQDGFKSIIPLWEAQSVSIGKKVQLTTPLDTFVATPIKLTETGALLVKLDDGSERTIFSAQMGEVN